MVNKFTKVTLIILLTIAITVFIIWSKEEILYILFGISAIIMAGFILYLKKLFKETSIVQKHLQTLTFTLLISGICFGLAFGVSMVNMVNFFDIPLTIIASALYALSILKMLYFMKNEITSTKGDLPR